MTRGLSMVQSILAGGPKMDGDVRYGYGCPSGVGYQFARWIWSSYQVGFGTYEVQYMQAIFEELASFIIQTSLQCGSDG
jgi:hypothetical protein